MTTWANPCTATDPQGRPCGLSAGHTGDHQLATWAPAQSKTTAGGTVRAVLILGVVVVVAYLLTQYVI